MAIDFPNSPAAGDSYTVGTRKWIWDGSTWRVSTTNFGYAVQETAPTSPVAGDVWLNTSSGKLFVYYDSTWVEPVKTLSGDTPAEDLVGNTLASNVVYSSIDRGRRNRVVNGDFQIWQRGQGGFSDDNGYSADRWKQNNVGTTQVITRETFTVGNTIPGYESQYYLRSVVTTSAGASNRAIVQNIMESVRTFAGQEVTLSFWAKADAAKNIAVELNQNFGQGGSPSAVNNGIGPKKVSLTTSWARYTVQFTVPSVLGKTVGTTYDGFLYVVFWFDAGSTYNARTDTLGQQSGTFDLWGVQLEAGPVATPFETMLYERQQFLCERYYRRWKTTDASGNPTMGQGFANGSDTAKILISLNTPMAYHPALTVGGVSHFLNNNIGETAETITLSATESSDRVMMLIVTVGGPVLNITDHLVFGSGDPEGWIALSAELS